MDIINHPPHYTSGKFESIDVIEDVISQIPDSTRAYYIGQILKYILRHQHKGGLDDLRKAQWFLNRLINKKYLNEVKKMK